MNSTAKYSFALLTTGALAASAIVCALAACTVGSTTDGDTDGGKNTSSSGTVSSSTSSSGAATSSSGAVADAGTCTQNHSGIILDSQACQDCLNTSCCNETAACFNVADVSDGTGCDKYLDCLTSCDDKPETVDSCKGLCKTAAQPQVPGLYDSYLTCRTNSCASACAIDTTTGGPPDPADGGKQ
jgi:hypothetical protein